jgi:tRNA (cmo5U34)-methyltransferase
MRSTKPFAFDTIKDFDDHISRSIPNYDLLCEAIISIAPYFLLENTPIVDLGCSTGNIMEQLEHEGTKYGYDISRNLLPKNHDNCIYALEDIADNNFQMPDQCSLVLSIFTMQFLPRSQRPQLMRKIHESLVEGGAFIWAEKVHGDSPFWEHTLNSSHYDFKHKWFTSEEILDKERDLRGMMRLQTSNQNVSMAREAGFFDSTLLWKFYNFECHIMVKERTNDPTLLWNIFGEEIRHEHT